MQVHAKKTKTTKQYCVVRSKTRCNWNRALGKLVTHPLWDGELSSLVNRQVWVRLSGVLLSNPRMKGEREAKEGWTSVLQTAYGRGCGKIFTPTTPPTAMSTPVSTPQPVATPASALKPIAISVPTSVFMFTSYLHTHPHLRVQLYLHLCLHLHLHTHSSKLRPYLHMHLYLTCTFTSTHCIST